MEECPISFTTHSSTLAWNIPWMEEPGELQSMGSRRVRHDWVTSPFTFHFHALEKEMATHSSVLAWRTPGTRKPGGLPSMGSHRVGHDWSDLAAAAAVSLLLQADFVSQEGATLHCSAWASLHGGTRASGVAALGLGIYGACAQLPLDIWSLPRQEIEPVYPALADGFSTTGPPGKSIILIMFYHT